jgi:hypothetical protein
MKTLTIKLNEAVNGAVSFFNTNKVDFSIYDLTVHLRRSVNARVYRVDEFLGTDDTTIGVQEVPHTAVRDSFFDLLESDSLDNCIYKGLVETADGNYRSYGCPEVKDIDGDMSIGALIDSLDTDTGRDKAVYPDDDDDDDVFIRDIVKSVDTAQQQSNNSFDYKMKNLISGGKGVVGKVIDTVATSQPVKKQAHPEPNKTTFILNNGGTRHQALILSNDILRKIKKYCSNRKLNNKSNPTLKMIQSTLKADGITCGDLYAALNALTKMFSIDKSSDKVSTYTVKTVVTLPWHRSF